MSDHTPPGWYYAEGDPPGTQRYWDGELWRGEPEPITPPPPTHPAPPMHTTAPAPWPVYPAARPYYPESSQATTALVCSILGFLCCGLLFPVGWKLGHDEVVAIDNGRRDPTNRSTANAAKIIGIIGTVLLVLGVVLYAVAIGFAFGPP